MKSNLSQKHLFIITVLTPTLLAAIYYCFICTPRYVSESTFSIRSSQGGSSDLLQSITGLPSNNSGSIVEDNYAIQELIHSNALINGLPDSLSLKSLFMSNHIDYLSKLRTDTMRDELNYWKKRVHIKVDALSNLSKLSVEAYSPEEAQALNQYLLSKGEAFINQLSNRLQADALSQSQEELSRGEKRLALANQQLNQFLNDKGEIDPVKVASSRGELIANLEAQLASKQTELSAQQAFLKSNSSSLSALRGEIRALRAQINKQKARLRGATEKTTELLSEHQSFLLEKQFSEQAYASALATMEKSRIEASTKKRYLIRILEPSLPDETLKPVALRKIFSVALFSFLLWGIGSLLLATIRDHIGVI